jgi:aquacobalamin reductase/NAD(P)H-flavin reductase
LTTYQVYVAGRFEMAKVVRDDFIKQGLPITSLFGDAYAFI